MKQFTVTLASFLVVATVNAVNLSQVPTGLAQAGQTSDDDAGSIFQSDQVEEDNELDAASFVPGATCDPECDPNGCPCNGFCDDCDCPHLQDAVIVPPENSGTGTVIGEITLGTEITGTITENIGDKNVCHATATNTCGLETTNNKTCGEAKHYKFFDICGGIKVCEHEKTYGCEGARECSDGRFTKTSQSYTALKVDDDASITPIEG